MENEVKLYSNRLVLRRWKADDSARLYKLAKDKDVGPRCGWMPHQNEDESSYIIKTILDVDETYAICLKDSGEIIGCVSLKIGNISGLNLPSDEAELGYWLGKSYWNKGYATEAAKAIIERAFKELAIKMLWCRHFDGNDASGHVAEKCGFKYVRTDYDVFWELLNTSKTIHVRKLAASDYLTGNEN